jgi:hypothetical protein
MAVSEHIVGIRLCCADFKNSNFFAGFLAAAEAEREPGEAADKGNIERVLLPVLRGGRWAKGGRLDVRWSCGAEWKTWGLDLAVRLWPMIL